MNSPLILGMDVDCEGGPSVLLGGSEVHPVDEVDVRDPARAKHHIRPLRPPFRRMTGLILWTDIGLHLNDLTCEYPTIDRSNQILADQRSCYRKRRAIEIDARKNSGLSLHIASL